MEDFDKILNEFAGDKKEETKEETPELSAAAEKKRLKR